MKLLYTFLLSWMQLSFCYAQPNFCADKPLASVTCYLRDHSGNDWLCTKNGIYVHNGRSFKNYTKKDGLISNKVDCILEDRKGTIWLGSHEGVCYYDGKGFKNFAVPGLDKSNTNFLYTALREYTDFPLSKSITCMLQDTSGNIWFASANRGLFCYTNGYFIHFQYSNGNWNRTPGNSLINLTFADQVAVQPFIENLFTDKNGIIWICTRTITDRSQSPYIQPHYQQLHFYWFDNICFHSGDE